MEKDFWEHVRVAHALEALPLVVEAFGTGRISYSKVRAITRVATPATEAQLLEWADHATASQLERIVAGRRAVARHDSAVGTGAGAVPKRVRPPVPR